MDGIYVWWIGMQAEDPPVMKELADWMTVAFDLPATVWRSPDRPGETYDVRRRQHSSTGILRWLASRRPAGATKLLGVTDVDLFIPVLTFVYGEAQLRGHCAVVSAARLGDAMPVGASLRVARLAKECVHELGHTFGLVHCDAPRCVMSRSINLAAVDGKSATLCRDCRLLYLERVSQSRDGHE
jgi:archaemetzincin